jgi:hypothetical protein
MGRTAKVFTFEQPTIRKYATFRSGVGPGLDRWKGPLMDVTRLFWELRAERERIDQAILSLERSDRCSTVTTEAGVTIRDRNQMASGNGRAS